MTESSSTIIEDVDELKNYLQVAIQLEHATIPPYLTAAYSAKVEENKDSIDILCAVAREEMLHLATAANLLNAIGGQPNLISPDFVPCYPVHLPTGEDDFDVGIERFSEDVLKVFLNIERPASLDPGHSEVVHHKKNITISGQLLNKSSKESANPLVPAAKVGDNEYELRYDIALIPHHKLTDKRRRISEAGGSLIRSVRKSDSEGNEIVLHYWSIGAFYRAIHLGFVELTLKMGEEVLFAGDPSKQVASKHFKQISSQHYYSAGGNLLEITDLKNALAAIDLVAGQGEGFGDRVYDDSLELAHYYRFDQILRKQYYRVPDPDGKNGDQAGRPQGGLFPVDLNAGFPMKTNAKIADYSGHAELEERALLFNGQYKRFLETLNTAFNGHPENLGSTFAKEMFSIKAAMQRLIHNAIPGTNENAAPTFEMDKFKYPSATQSSERASARPTPAAVSSRADLFEDFIRLSVQLCGISSFDLMGTGYARSYFETVEDILGHHLLVRLLEAFAAVPATEVCEDLPAAILNHPEFGPIARNIIKLWYTATWFQLPATWRENFGALTKDRTFVPYPYAYAESLLGPAVGAHPAGAKPTGHQSWTLPPEYLPIPDECV